VFDVEHCSSAIRHGSLPLGTSVLFLHQAAMPFEGRG
jgi:hypothetical protein